MNFTFNLSNKPRKITVCKYHLRWVGRALNRVRYDLERDRKKLERLFNYVLLHKAFYLFWYQPDTFYSFGNFVFPSSYFFYCFPWISKWNEQNCTDQTIWNTSSDSIKLLNFLYYHYASVRYRKKVKMFSVKMCVQYERGQEHATGWKVFISFVLGQIFYCKDHVGQSSSSCASSQVC